MDPKPLNDAGRGTSSRRRLASPWLVAVAAFVVLVGGFLMLAVNDPGDQLERARLAAANATLTTIRDRVGYFHSDLGRYPTAAEGLNALVRPPSGSRGGIAYLDQPAIDPWGRPYVYQLGAGGTSYKVLSAGPDGKVGTADDIVVAGPAPGAATTGPAASPGNVGGAGEESG